MALFTLSLSKGSTKKGGLSGVEGQILDFAAFMRHFAAFTVDFRTFFLLIQIGILNFAAPISSF